MAALRLVPLAALAMTLPAQEPDPVLSRLPADATTVLVVRDVLPHVDALLDSPELADVLAASGDIQQELFGMRFDAAGLRRQFGLFRALVPVEVVVAASDRTVADLVRLFEVGLAVAVLPLVRDADGEGAAAAAAVRNAANVALREFGTVDVAARVRARDERTAEGWFDQIAGAVEALPVGDGLEVEVVDTRITLRVWPLRCLGGRVREQLTRAGLVVPEDLDLRVVASVEQRSSELELRIGAPSAGPLAAAQLGPQWQPQAGQVMFSKIDAGTAAAAGYAFAELAFALSEHVPEEMALRLFALGTNCLELMDPTIGSIVVDRGFVMTKETDVGEDVEGELDDPDPAVVRCVAPGGGPFVLSALPLDAVAAGTLDDVAVRLARRGHTLHLELAQAIEFLAGEESAVFAPGTLLVARAAAFRGAAKWQLGPLPFASAALVAKAHDAAAASTFVAQLTRHLCDGYGVEAPLWRDADLGLGVPTQVLDLAALVPDHGELGIDADFAPHWCVVDDVLVVATDPKLTADLVARIRGEVAPQLPVKRLIDWTLWAGDDWAGACAGLAQWVRAMPDAAPRGLPQLGALLDGLAALCRTCESFETVTELDGGTLREVTRLRLRASK